MLYDSLLRNSKQYEIQFFGPPCLCISNIKIAEVQFKP